MRHPLLHRTRKFRVSAIRDKRIQDLTFPVSRTRLPVAHAPPAVAQDEKVQGLGNQRQKNSRPDFPRFTHPFASSACATGCCTGREISGSRQSETKEFKTCLSPFH